MSKVLSAHWRMSLAKSFLKSVAKTLIVGPCQWSSDQHACLLSDDLSSNPAEAYSFVYNICV